MIHVLRRTESGRQMEFVMCGSTNDSLWRVAYVRPAYGNLARSITAVSRRTSWIAHRRLVVFWATCGVTPALSSRQESRGVERFACSDGGLTPARSVRHQSGGRLSFAVIPSAMVTSAGITRPFQFSITIWPR